MRIILFSEIYNVNVWVTSIQWAPDVIQLRTMTANLQRVIDLSWTLTQQSLKLWGTYLLLNIFLSILFLKWNPKWPLRWFSWFALRVEDWATKPKSLKQVVTFPRQTAPQELVNSQDFGDDNKNFTAQWSWVSSLGKKITVLYRQWWSPPNCPFVHIKTH